MPRHEGVRDGRYKVIHYVDYNTYEFYDLKNDPNELRNCIDDPKYTKEVERMKGRLHSLLEKYDAPAMKPLVPKKKKRKKKN